MKKFITLTLIICMIFSTSIAFADTSSSRESFSKDNNAGISYDMDDFAEYMQSNIDKEDTSILVEKYFKNLRIKEDNGNSNNAKLDKSIINKEGTKVLKEVKLDDTQSVTFYSNGTFAIDKLTVGDETIADKASNTFISASTVYSKTGSNTYTLYSQLGVKIVSLSVSSTFWYDGNQVAVVSQPNSTYTLNTTYYDLVFHDTLVIPGLGIWDTYSAETTGRLRASAKSTVYEIIAHCSVFCLKDGTIQKSQGAEEL